MTPPDKPSLAERLEALNDQMDGLEGGADCGVAQPTKWAKDLRAIAAELGEIAAMLREDGDPTCVYDAARRLAGKEGM